MTILESLPRGEVPVAIDQDVQSVIEHASMHRFVPVIDACGKLVGIVDRRRIPDVPLPSAA